MFERYVVLAGRGLLRERMGQVREASADLAAACLLEPSNAAFLRNRGVNSRTNGDYAAALADLTHVLRLVPNDTVALANRGCSKKTCSSYYLSLYSLTIGHVCGCPHCCRPGLLTCRVLCPVWR